MSLNAITARPALSPMERPTFNPGQGQQPHTTLGPAPDSVQLNPEGPEAGSIPDFGSAFNAAIDPKKCPTANPNPVRETPEQKKAREAQWYKKNTGLVDKQNGEWDRKTGPFWGAKPFKAPKGPHKMPKTGTPQEKKARDAEFDRRLEEKHRKLAAPRKIANT